MQFRNLLSILCTAPLIAIPQQATAQPGDTPGVWQHISGSSFNASNGNYATTPLHPGARYVPGFCAGNDGQTFWLYGGEGHTPQRQGIINDLWSYNTTTEQWTLEGNGGQLTQQIPELYGNGFPYPGSRAYPCLWTDRHNNLWLFGGIGIDPGGPQTNYNDVWKFDTASKIWKRIKPHNYNPLPEGTRNGPYPHPSARQMPASWTGPDGNLWLFSGGGGQQELWQYVIPEEEWIEEYWILKSNTDITSTHDTTNPHGYTLPEERYFAATCTDKNGNLWLFGGLRNLDIDARVDVGDLWKFDTTIEKWVHASGTMTPGQASQLDGPTPHPGSRWGAALWAGTDGAIWMFGGQTVAPEDSPHTGYLNDLWRYDIALNQWQFQRGVTDSEVNGIYTGRNATPGSRNYMAYWTDDLGNFRLFGGRGYAADAPHSHYSFGNLNDQWRYSPSATYTAARNWSEFE